MASNFRKIPTCTVPADGDVAQEAMKRSAGRGAILDILTGESWEVSIPVKRGWRWRKIAFKLTVKLWMIRLVRLRQGGEIGLIDGINGKAVIQLTMHLRAPPHYEEARRQRAVIGLEGAEASGWLRHDELAKIAVSAATGLKLRLREREHFPPLVATWKNIRKLTDVGYAYCEGDSDMICMKITRIRNLTEGETFHDRAMDDAREADRQAKEAERQAREQDAVMAAEAKQAARAARKEENVRRHWAERGRTDEAYRPFEGREF